MCTPSNFMQDPETSKVKIWPIGKSEYQIAESAANALVPFFEFRKRVPLT